MLHVSPESYEFKGENCPKCGHLVNGHYCQGCALPRKKFKEVLFTSCIENGILQDSFEPSNDNTNVVNALREPFVVNQDPGKNSSQSPPQINHHCCYGCGDPLEGIFCHQCTCELCGNGAHYGYNCLPNVPIMPNPQPFNNQTIKELPPTVQCFDPKFDLVYDSPNIFNPPPQLPFYSCKFYGNDARYGHYCILQVPFAYPKPCYNQDIDFPQDFYDFQQQYLCCDNCGQYTINHPIFNTQNDLFDSQNKLMEQLTSMCDMLVNLFKRKKKKSKLKKIKSLMLDIGRFLLARMMMMTITPLQSHPMNAMTLEGKDECDVLACEGFTTFSNILFDSNYDFYSSDDQSLSDEDFLKEIYSNPLFDEEIIPMKIDPHHFNVESDLIKSMLDHDSSIISFSSKMDSLFDDDSLMEEIDLSFTPDYPMPPTIEEDDYDSERDILILEELLINDSFSLPENESFHFDIPSFSRPPAKPPDGNT
nr:hypothetical protein [Tanacetum cinerariifolium]